MSQSTTKSVHFDGNENSPHSLSLANGILSNCSLLDSTYSYQASVHSQDVSYDFIGSRCLGKSYMDKLGWFIEEHAKKGVAFMAIALLSLSYNIITYNLGLQYYILKAISVSPVLLCIFTINFPVMMNLLQYFETFWIFANFMLNGIFWLLLDPLPPALFSLQIYCTCVFVWFIVFTDAVHPKLRILATKLGWSYCLIFYSLQVLIFGYLKNDDFDNKIPIIKVNGQMAYSVFSLMLSTTMNMLVFSASFCWCIWRNPQCYVIWQSQILVCPEDRNTLTPIDIRTIGSIDMPTLPSMDTRTLRSFEIRTHSFTRPLSKFPTFVGRTLRDSEYHVTPRIEIQDWQFQHQYLGLYIFPKEFVDFALRFLAAHPKKVILWSGFFYIVGHIASDLYQGFPLLQSLCYVIGASPLVLVWMTLIPERLGKLSEKLAPWYVSLQFCIECILSYEYLYDPNIGGENVAIIRRILYLVCIVLFFPIYGWMDASAEIYRYEISWFGYSLLSLYWLQFYIQHITGMTAYTDNKSLEIFGFTILKSTVALSYTFMLNISTFLGYFSVHSYAYPRALCLLKARLYADVEEMDDVLADETLKKFDFLQVYSNDESEHGGRRIQTWRDNSESLNTKRFNTDRISISILEAIEEPFCDHTDSACKEIADSSEENQCATRMKNPTSVHFNVLGNSSPEEHTLEQTPKSANEKHTHFKQPGTSSPEMYSVERADSKYGFIWPLACHTNCACDSSDSEIDGDLFYAE